MIKNENNNQSNQELQGGQNPPGDDAEHLRKLFIGGLSPTTTEESLRAFFRQWGEVVDAVVMRDPVSKRSRGFGFISFAEPSMIDKAQAARPHVIDGKSVDSKRALPRPELAKPESSSTIKKIFVGGLKDVHDEKALTEHFSQFGNVIGVKILTDRNTGKKRGFAFVEFDDYDAVDKAVLHKSHIIKHVAVDVKKSVYQQELAKKLAQQQKGNMPMPPGGANPAPVPYPQHPYNQPAPYQYPSQMPPQSGMYNGWGGYGPPNAGPPYQQPPPMAGPGYGPYGGGPPNNAGSWNAAGNYPGWGQNGYSNSPAAPVPAPNANAWNSTAPQQNFGDYQQAYNGGPQKAGNLQGNRMNPYSVAPNSTYGSSAHANNMYGLPNNVSKLATAVIANGGGGGGGALPKTLVPFRAGAAAAVDAADGASKKPVPLPASDRRPI